VTTRREVIVLDASSAMRAGASTASVPIDHVGDGGGGELILADG